jgi:FMN-dependent NADH-azoreductase
MTGKQVAVVYARGGGYPPGSEGEAVDLQKRYLELILGFIGLTDPKSIVIEPTLAKPDQVDKTLEEARKKAETVAASF